MLLEGTKMDKKVAEKIVHSVMNAYTALGDLDLAISELSSDDERRRFSSALGLVLQITREQMLLPIFGNFPDLIPPKLSGRKS